MGDQYWSASLYAALPEPVQRGRKVLQDWFERIERGIAELYAPEGSEVTQQEADILVEYLDNAFEREVKAWAKQPQFGSREAGPGFARLAPPQRRALAQELKEALRGWEKLPKLEAPNVAVVFDAQQTIFSSAATVHIPQEAQDDEA